MKFYFLVAALLCINFSHGQDVEDEDYYYEEEGNKNVVEGGLNYFVPQSDFRRKSPDRKVGGDISYLRQINYSRFFLGFSYSSRQLDEQTILQIEPDVDSQAKISNANYALIARFYPQVYFSIFELFADAGIGIHRVRSITREYDVLAEEHFNQNTIQQDRKFFMQAGGGIHMALTPEWFFTTKIATFFGPTVELLKRDPEVGTLVFPEEAFITTNAAYRASTISLSLSFIF